MWTEWFVRTRCVHNRTIEMKLTYRNNRFYLSRAGIENEIIVTMTIRGKFIGWLYQIVFTFKSNECCQFRDFFLWEDTQQKRNPYARLIYWDVHDDQVYQSHVQWRVDSFLFLTMIRSSLPHRYWHPIVKLCTQYIHIQNGWMASSWPFQQSLKPFIFFFRFFFWIHKTNMLMRVIKLSYFSCLMKSVFTLIGYFIIINVFYR